MLGGRKHLEGQPRSWIPYDSAECETRKMQEGEGDMSIQIPSLMDWSLTAFVSCSAALYSNLRSKWNLSAKQADDPFDSGVMTRKKKKTIR